MTHYFRWIVQLSNSSTIVIRNWYLKTDIACLFRPQLGTQISENRNFTNRMNIRVVIDHFPFISSGILYFFPIYSFFGKKSNIRKWLTTPHIVLRPTSRLWWMDKSSPTQKEILDVFSKLIFHWIFHWIFHFTTHHEDYDSVLFNKLKWWMQRIWRTSSNESWKREICFLK